MSTKSIKLSILSLLFAICGMFTLVFAVGTTKETKADDALFQFETTAYAKLEGNGGLRFRLKMNDAAKTAIGSDSITLYAAAAHNAEGAADAAAWETLYNETKAWKNDVAANRIYAGQNSDESYDGYRYVNYLLDINTFDAEYRTADFVAFAVVGDLKATSASANLYAAVNSAALDGQDVAVYDWLGTKDYPIVVKTADEYAALGTILAANGDLYYSIDGVEDTAKYTDTYTNGTVNYNVTFKYADGQEEVIPAKSGVGLLSAPAKYDLGHRAENSLAVKLTAVSDDSANYLKTRKADTVVEYQYITGGGKKLSVSNDSLTTVELGKNGTGTVATSPYITVTEESFNTLSFVRLADTVSGTYVLNAHFDAYSDQACTGFKVTDQNGNYLLFGFGSKNNRVLLGKNGVGNQGTTLQSSPSYIYSSAVAHNGKETVGGVDRWRYDYRVSVYKNGAGDWAAKFLTRNTTMADITDDIKTGWVDRTTFVLKDVINTYASSYFAYDAFDWEGTLTVDIMMLNNKKDGDKAIIEISQWIVDDKEG